MTTMTISEQRAALFTRQRRGQGKHADYRPGYTLNEVPKAGRVHRYPCTREGRTVTLRSDGALAEFLEVLWDSRTTGFCESVLLDVKRTSAIARHLHLRHPAYEDGSPRNLITDLLVTRELPDGSLSEEAVDTVSRAPSDPAHLPARLTIIREYWESQGVAWRLSVKDGLNSNRAMNLNWLYMVGEHVRARGLSDHERYVQRLIENELFDNFHWTVEDACLSATRANRLRPGESVRALRQLLAMQRIKFDIDAASVMSLSPRQLHLDRRQPRVASGTGAGKWALRISRRNALATSCVPIRCAAKGQSEPTRQSGEETTFPPVTRLTLVDATS